MTRFIVCCVVVALSICSCKKDKDIIVEKTIVKRAELIIELLSPSSDQLFDAGTKEVNLSWHAEGASNLVYDIYFGDDTSTYIVKSNFVGQEYKVQDLEDGKTYSWKIVVKDGNYLKESEVVEFSIKDTQVVIPAVKGVVIQWPNVNASSYSILLGEDSASTYIVENIVQTTYRFEGLVYGRKYHYKIIANGSYHKFEEQYFYYREEGVKIFNGNVLCKNQDDINKLGRSQFSEITGSLSIKQNYNYDVVSLLPLASLRYLGSLSVSYIHNLDSFFGLGNIRFIMGDLIIDRIFDLKEVDMNSLFFVGGDIRVCGNNYLEDLSFNSLAYIYGDFILGGKKNYYKDSGFKYYSFEEHTYGNLSLKSVNIGSVTEFDKGVYIYFNPKLENLDFMANVTGISTDLLIYDNDGLRDISGLNSLEIIAESFNIVGNESIETIVLDKLYIIPNFLFINSNSSIKEVSFPKLETVGQINIGFNDNLKRINDFNSLNAVSQGIGIYNNHNLNYFCGLNYYFKYHYSYEPFLIRANFYNPSLYDIKQGYCDYN